MPSLFVCCLKRDLVQHPARSYKEGPPGPPAWVLEEHPPQAKHSLDPVVPVMPHLQTLSCRLAAAGERQELLPRGSAQPGGLSELEKTLWMEQQPGQASRTSAGLTCPQPACCGAQGAARGAQRMLKDLEKPTHQPDNPSTFLSPVLIPCFHSIHSQAQVRWEKQACRGVAAHPVRFHLI